jgi:NCS2 family nucleobase:cation symporter-2/xanthine permease XanP
MSASGNTSENTGKNGPPTPGNLLFAVNENPPEWLSALLGLQLILIIAGPIALTPVVVARQAGIDPGQIPWIIFASFTASAIGTLIQVHRFGRVGSGYLLFVGSSGTFLACALSAAEIGGMSLVASMSVLSAPLQILFGWFLGPLRRIITPAVGGVVIMLIVVSVLGIALDLMNGRQGPGPDLNHLLVSIFTLAGIVALAVFGNKALRLWSLFIGICAGTFLSLALGMADFSRVAEESWLGMPQMGWQGFNLDFGPEFFSLYLAFALVTVVGAVETLGDSMAIQQVSDRNFRKINYDTVQGAIYADGIANAIAGALGTLPNTTYSNAISAVELTGVAARRVGYYTSLFLALLAFCPKVSALLAAIPSPVVGAFLFMLLAMLFVTGIKLATSQGLSYENSIVIGLSFWIGYTFQNDLFFAEFIPRSLAPFLNNGMAVGGVSAILLSLLFNLKPAGQAKFALKRQPDEASRLRQFLKNYAATRNIPSYLEQKLHLTAEELFLHLCTSRQAAADSLRVKLRKGEETLQVEFIDSGFTWDLDDQVEAVRARQGEFSSEDLGLLLLDRYAQNLRHIAISGYNYISYELPL